MSTNIKLSEIAKYCIIALASAFIILKGIIPGWQEGPADFNNYFVASKLVTEGEAIHQFYNNDWFKSKAVEMGISSGAKFAPFPPATAYLFLPLTPFTPLTAKRIWLVINCTFLLLIGLKTKKHLGANYLNSVLFICMFTIPIANCISFGQVYLLFAIGLLQIVLSKVKQNRLIWTGLILGFTSALKYLPILFATYFYKHPSKVKLWTFTFVTVVIIFSLIFFVDPLSYKNFLQTFSSHLNGDLSGQGKYAVGFQSLDSLLNNLFVYDHLLNPSPILNLAALKPIIKLFVVAAIGVILFILFKKSSYKLNRELISISIIGSFIIFPATASYHFLLLFLPMVLLYNWLFPIKKLRIFFIVIAVFTFSIQFHHMPELISFPIFNLIIHYPRFWCLILLFSFVTYNYSKLLHLPANA